jgi:hypothetical protein
LTEFPHETRYGFFVTGQTIRRGTVKNEILLIADLTQCRWKEPLTGQKNVISKYLELLIQYSQTRM